MERKTLAADVTVTDAGDFQGYASTFANWDDVQERPVKGAFTPHLTDFLKDGFIAIGHDWNGLPVATPTEAYEDANGLFLKADFHSTQFAQDARTTVKERLDRGKSVKLSIGYAVLEDEYTQEGRLLKQIKLYEVSIVTVPANNRADMLAAKRMPLGDQSDAVLVAVKDFVHRYQSVATLRAKEGRALSSANRQRITDAVGGLRTHAQELEALLQDTEPAKGHATETQKLYRHYLESRAKTAYLLEA